MRAACRIVIVSVLMLIPGALLVIGSAAAEQPREQAGTVNQPDVIHLDDLVREALQKNPAVLSSGHRVEALRHRVPQVRSLPDPMLTTGWVGNPEPFSVQTGDPSSARMFIASQQVPWPGKLKLRGQVASKEVDAAAWDSETTRRRVTADVKTAYYELYFRERALETTAKNKDLLQKLAKISEARYRVGKAVQSDVLRAQVELSSLSQRVAVLEQEKALAQARINTLLFRDPESPLLITEGAPKPVLEINLEQLYSVAKTKDPGLRREESMIGRSELAVSLAQREYYPDLGVAYQYQQRPLLPDMHGLAFTVNVPIFYRSKQREAVKEMNEELLSAQQSRDDRIATLSFSVKEQYLAAYTSKKLADLYSQAIVPQSALSLESSMSSYEVGTSDFLTVLTNFSLVLDYETNYYREVANFHIAMARLEELVGPELVH